MTGQEGGAMGKKERRWLKEAAQAERQGEGLSGGRCSMTNLTTPHLSFTPVPFTKVGPPRLEKLAKEQTLVSHFPLSLLPSFVSPYPTTLSAWSNLPFQIAPFLFDPSFLSTVSPVCFLFFAAGPPGFVVFKSYKTPVALSRWTAFPLLHSAWPSWQINLDWIEVKKGKKALSHRVPEAVKLKPRSGAE